MFRSEGGHISCTVILYCNKTSVYTFNKMFRCFSRNKTIKIKIKLINVGALMLDAIEILFTGCPSRT